MKTTRLWMLGSVVVIIALLIGTWFVGISPRLAEAAIANNESATVEAQNAAHEATLASLKTQFEGIRDLRSDLEGLRVAVPADADTADLIRQLNAFAVSAGVTVTGVSLSPPERFAAPAEPPSDTELAGAITSVNPENFLAVRIEVDVAGPYANVMAFVSSVQAGERVFLVHDLTLDSGIPSPDSSVEVRFSGQVFVLLDGVAAVGEGDGAAVGETVPTEGAPIAE